MELTFDPPHPMLFICDAANMDVLIPEYEVGIPTATSTSCVSVATQADVDGHITVILVDSYTPEPGMLKVFQGAIHTPGKKVAVMTSHREAVLELDIGSDNTLLSIWTDNLIHPSTVAVEAKPSHGR